MLRKSLAVLSALVAAVGIASATPVLTVDNVTFDAGDAAEGSKVKATFKLTNTGTSELKITSVRPECGCTIVKYDSIVAPGRTIVLEPVVDLKGMRPGLMNRGVNITTNAPDMPKLRLVIAANIVAPIEMSERFLHFDGSGSVTLFLTSAKKNLRVNGIVFKPHQSGGQGVPGWAADVPIDIRYNFTPERTREDGLAVYKLEISPPPGGDRTNPISGTFQISTNHAEKRELTINGQVAQ